MGGMGRLSEDDGILLGKTYPLNKKATMAKEPEWARKLEE